MPILIKGLRETRVYLRRLSKSVPKAMSNSVTGPDNIEEFTGIAVRVVQDVVYAVYDRKKYDRTFHLLQSIGAFTIRAGNPSKVGIGLKIDRSPAIWGEAKDQVSYGIFMLPEHAADSFFKGAAAASIPRDFAAAWLQIFGDVAPAKVVDALDKELKR